MGKLDLLVKACNARGLLEKRQKTFSLQVATGEAIPLRGLEGVPGLPGAPQDEAGLTRKFETSHVGAATCRTPPDSPVRS